MPNDSYKQIKENEWVYKPNPENTIIIRDKKRSLNNNNITSIISAAIDDMKHSHTLQPYNNVYDRTQPCTNPTKGNTKINIFKQSNLRKTKSLSQLQKSYGQGNSCATPEKHKQIRKYMENYIESSLKHITTHNDCDKTFYYYDTHAGSGLYANKYQDDILKGSPIIFLETITRLNTIDILVIANFFDKDNDKLTLLSRNINRLGYNTIPWLTINLILGDYKVTFPEYSKPTDNKPRYGIIFTDPNSGVPDIKTFKKFYTNPTNKHIDFLSNMSLSDWKRQRNNPRIPHMKKTLLQEIKSINKSEWYCTQPYNNYRKWTIFAGTNYKIPTNMNMINIKSPEAKDIIQISKYTKKELMSNSI